MEGNGKGHKDTKPDSISSLIESDSTEQHLARFFLGDIVKGLMTTLKHLGRKPVTVQYPKERRPVSSRYRGLHIFCTDEEGKEACNGCGLCVRSCPDAAIELVATGKGKERTAESYTIDLGRCMFCGLCVEACPRDAIRMTDYYELADYSRENLKVGKDFLKKKHVPKKYKK